MGLGTPVADVVLEVSLSDELLNLVLEGDAFFHGVADISVKLLVFILVPLRAISPHQIWSFIHARVLYGQEYTLTRPCQVGEVIVLARSGSRDPLIWALGLLLVGIRRSLLLHFLLSLFFSGDRNFPAGAISCGASTGVDISAWTASLAVSRRIILSARL